MNATIYGKVWTYLGIATSVTALNIVIQSQGGLLFSGGYLIEKRPVIACYYGAVLIAFLTAAVCWAGAGYARLATSAKPWALRLPLIGDEGKEPVDGSAWSTKAYQAFFLAALVFAPAYALLHCNRKVWNDGVIWSDAPGASENAVPVKCTVVAAEGCDPKRWAAVRAGPPDSHLWLAETVHDPQHFQSQRDLKKPPPNPDLAYQMHDLSDACRKDSEACRGVEWEGYGSIALLWGTTSFAFACIVLFLCALAKPGAPPAPPLAASGSGQAPPPSIPDALPPGGAALPETR